LIPATFLIAPTGCGDRAGDPEKHAPRPHEPEATRWSRRILISATFLIAPTGSGDRAGDPEKECFARVRARGDAMVGADLDFGNVPDRADRQRRSRRGS
jgi:hypothetical protein